MDDTNIQDKWLRKELELDQRHEEILTEREELLSRQRVRILNHENKVRQLSKDLEVARNRNKRLMEEIELFEKNMENRQKAHGVNSELDVLKAGYWQMVMRELSAL